jgi:hypothetical protein
VLLAVVVGALLVACHPVPASCSLAGQHPKVWVGGSGNWHDSAQNWDPPGIPGDFNPNNPSPATESVCIPAGSVVHIEQGAEQHLVAIDNDGTLILDEAGDLYLEGPQMSESTNELIMNHGAILGGPGHLTIEGSGSTLQWGDPSNISGGPSLMTTRRLEDLVALDCNEDPPPNPGDCVTPEGQAGRLIIDAGAFLEIVGNFGRTMRDGRVIENHGTTILGGSAYLAADWGTGFENHSGARFEVHNNKGYYQGYLYPPHPRSTFDNQGTLTKVAGSGTSVFDVEYSGTGSVAVGAGTLSIVGEDDVVTAHAVQPRKRFRNGGFCDFNFGTCNFNVNPNTDAQITTVEVPAGSPRSVELDENVAAPPCPNVDDGTGQPDAPLRDIGDPTGIALSGGATGPTNPIRLELRLDNTQFVDSDPNTTDDIAICRQRQGVTNVYESVHNPCPPGDQAPADGTPCIRSISLPDGATGDRVVTVLVVSTHSTDIYHPQGWPRR